MKRLSWILPFVLVLPVLGQTLETALVTAATAPIRAEAKATAAVLTTVKKGAKLEVRGTEGDFYQVVTSVGTVRIQGFVAKRSVALEKLAAPPPTSAPAPAAGTSAPLAKFGMTAVVTSAAKPINLVPVTARVVKLAERVETARAAAIAMPVGAGTALPTAPASLISYVWVIDTVTGAREVADTKPAIVVQYRDAAGMSPEDFSPAIVRLIGTPSGPRVVSALRGRLDQGTRAQAEWDIATNQKVELVRATTEITDRGVAKLTVTEPLTPGEYAVIMRPTGNKKFAGTSVLAAAEEGRFFSIAWAFVVR